jgi:large subunit ribosomal protein L4
MQLKLISKNGKPSGTVDVSDQVFAYELNEPLIHQVVVSYLANARQGSKAQKNRSAVRGGGKKPWRQKGTGRARAGTIRSPLWRKGGVTFAAKPQDYSQKVNKKMYHRAMRSILSELIRQDRMQVIENFTLESRKTRDFIAKLSELNHDLNKNKKIMLVLDNVDLNMHFASSNIPNVFVCDTTEVDPLSLVSCENIIVTPGVLKHFDEVLA